MSPAAITGPHPHRAPSWRRPVRLPDVVLGVTTFVVLWLIVPTLFRAAVVSPGRFGLLPLQINLLVASAIIGAQLTLGSRRFNLYTFSVFVYLWAGLAPIVQSESQRFFWPGAYTVADLERTAMITGLGVGAWLVGYWAFTVRRRVPVTWVIEDRRLVTTARYAIGGAVVVAVVFGLAVVLGGRGGFATLTTGVGGESLRQLARSLVIAAAVLAAIGLLRRRTLRANHRALFVVLVLVVVLLANPIGTARFVVGAVAVALLLAWAVDRGPATVRLVLVAILGGTLLIFPVADSFRFGVGQVDRVRFDRSLMYHGDYDAFQQTANVVQYVDAEGLTAGRQLVGNVLVGVPRAFWPAKPEPTGTMVATWFNYGYTNVSSPLWAEGYVDFGLLGALLLPFAFGWLAAFFDERLRSGIASAAGVLGVFAAGLQIVLVRGSLMGVSTLLVTAAVVTVVVMSRVRTAPVVSDAPAGAQAQERPRSSRSIRSRRAALRSDSSLRRK